MNRNSEGFDMTNEYQEEYGKYWIAALCILIGLSFGTAFGNVSTSIMTRVNAQELADE